MTRTISLITATVGAALLFVVPAWGDNWGADQQNPAIVNAMAEDGFDSAVLAAKQNHQTAMLNAREQALGVSAANSVDPLAARERALDTKAQVVLESDFYADGFAQAIGSSTSRPEPVRDDRFRLDPGNTPSVTTTSTGTEIEWPQVGILVGIGIVLLLGLGLAMRAAHVRPFAH